MGKWALCFFMGFTTLCFTCIVAALFELGDRMRVELSAMMRMNVHGQVFRCYSKTGPLADGDVSGFSKLAGHRRASHTCAVAQVMLSGTLFSFYRGQAPGQRSIASLVQKWWSIQSGSSNSLERVSSFGVHSVRNQLSRTHLHQHRVQHARLRR